MPPLVAQPACGAFEMTQKHPTMERIFLGSARVSRVGDCVLAIANFSKGSFRRGRRNEHARARVLSGQEPHSVSDLRFVLRQSR